MASVNKRSLREEFDTLKAEFERLTANGKLAAESRALFQAMLMLFEVLMAVFMEKRTAKDNSNSSLPPRRQQGGQYRHQPAPRARASHTMTPCPATRAPLPYIPRRLEGLAFITVFVDAENLPVDTPNGEGWKIYLSNEHKQGSRVFTGSGEKLSLCEWVVYAKRPFAGPDAVLAISRATPIASLLPTAVSSRWTNRALPSSGRTTGRRNAIDTKR